MPTHVIGLHLVNLLLSTRGWSGLHTTAASSMVVIVDRAVFSLLSLLRGRLGRGTLVC